VKALLPSPKAVRVAIIELVAGRVCERVMLSDDIEPLDASLDYAEARALARTLCQPCRCRCVERICRTGSARYDHQQSRCRRDTGRGAD
jgi:hypothetical protein